MRRGKEAKDLIMEAMNEEAETSWASESREEAQIFRNIQQHTQYEEWNIHITKMIIYIK